MDVWGTGEIENFMNLVWKSEKKRLETRQEAVFDLLEDLGEIPVKLRDRIENLEDIGKLKILIKISAKTDSIADFAKEAEPYLMSED